MRFDDIIGAIIDENKTIPGGSIDVNNSSFLVRVPGEFEKPYIIENIIVKLKDGNPIYVKDIAQVNYGFEDRQTYARLNEQNAVSISVSKRFWIGNARNFQLMYRSTFLPINQLILKRW